MVLMQKNMKKYNAKLRLRTYLDGRCFSYVSIALPCRLCPDSGHRYRAEVGVNTRKARLAGVLHPVVDIVATKVNS